MSAPQLIARPGTLPTLVVPVVRGRQPDVDGIWSYLAEPAEFFGVAMPRPAELAAALARFAAEVFDDAALAVATVTVVEGAPRIVVSGAEVPARSEAVRLEADAAPHVHRAGDPHWRRMAARTTSWGAVDQLARWLNRRGYVDGLSDGEPLLGALVCETADGLVGVENPEPTSVLDQLAACGALPELERAGACPSGADRVWWVSPEYRIHPVVELAGLDFVVECDAVPSFARWS